MMLDLEAFRKTPLVREPFPYLIVPGFVLRAARGPIHADYPQIERPGSFPLSELQYGPAFQRLVEELNGPAMRQAFEAKFGMDLKGRPSMITVRGRSWERDGFIHTDAVSKLITILIYMNPQWETPGGCLRLLRSADNLEDAIVEVPPLEGTLLAFRRTDNSWHGHRPFVGQRRVIQFNWVTGQRVVRREVFRHRLSALVKKLLPSGRPWLRQRRNVA